MTGRADRWNTALHTRFEAERTRPARDLSAQVRLGAAAAVMRLRLPGCGFAQADIASCQPQTPPDLIFANAALHWVPNHAALSPRLFFVAQRRG